MTHLPHPSKSPPPSAGSLHFGVRTDPAAGKAPARPPAKDWRGRCRDERSLRSRRRSRPATLAAPAGADTNITDRAVRPPRRRHRRRRSQAATATRSAPIERRRASAERADSCGRPAGREQDDGGRRTTTARHPRRTDAWAGFYYSGDGGASWVNSLLPGYPTDTSAEGRASPLFGFTVSSGDPVQDWDRTNHLYYGGIAFNRTRPTNGSIWVARYNWNAPFAAPDYEFTTIVSRGTPHRVRDRALRGQGRARGRRRAEQPARRATSTSAGRASPASGANNFIEFARSTDGGRTWTTQKISESVHGSQECDIAVTRTGMVFVTWRQYEFKANQGQQQRDAIAWVRSTDGGASFTKPAVAHEFTHWDMGDEAANPVANGQARFESCQAADGTLGGCEGPEPKQSARDCGDGPFVCQTGYVFGRVNSAPRNAADPVAGRGRRALRRRRGHAFPERSGRPAPRTGRSSPGQRARARSTSRRPRTAARRGHR